MDNKDIQLRLDHICENVQEVKEIRNLLAFVIRKRRTTDAYMRELCVVYETQIITLSWVLGRERSPLWSHGW